MISWLIARASTRPLASILVVALALRLAAAFALGNEVAGLSGAFDEVTYSMLGHRLADGHGLTFPEPWYPWIKADMPQSYFSFAMSASLGAVYSLFGYYPVACRLLMALASTAIVGMVFVLGRRFFNERLAVIAAMVAAFHAYLIFYGVTLVTETPFTLALLLSIYLADKIRVHGSPRLWIALGLTLAAAVHFRMSVVFFIPPLLLWVVAALPRSRWLSALLPTGVIVATVLPFTIWNYATWGQPLLLQSQFGHVFWNGNHPGHQGNFHPYRVFEIPPEVLALDNDAQITTRLLELGIESVQEDPAMFLKLTLTRLRELFVFWPTADSSPTANLLRVASFGLLVPFIVAGFVQQLSNWRNLMPIYLFIATHVGVHALTWSMVRYRVPLDPFLILFASSAIQSLWQAISQATPAPAAQAIGGAS